MREIANNLKQAPMPGLSKDSGELKQSLLEGIVRNPHIPTPPALALEIFQRLGRDDFEIGEIIKLLALDPGLSAKILRAVNSSLYSPSRPVTNVRQAVAILGLRPLRSLILGLVLPVMQTGLAPDESLRHFWRKSVAGAVMARELAVRSLRPAPDDVMAAGLLRDLGMILMHRHFQARYDPVWMQQGNLAGDTQCELEEEHFGVIHSEVAAALLEFWRLPSEIVEPIRFHHHPERAPNLVGQIVDHSFLLDFVSRLADLEGCPAKHAAIEEILQTARLRFGLERNEVEAFLNDIRLRIEEFSALLCVDIGQFPNLAELLLAGCEELVRASLDSAAAEANQDCTLRMQTVDQSINEGSRVSDLLFNLGEAQANSKILHYEVLEVIGRGAMGIVLRANDPRLARQVAIKLLAPELLSSEMARQRFALEARFAAGLRHEHIVAIHSVDEVDGVPFLVMEYVPGASLANLIQDGRTFTVPEIARLGRQVALGLAAAHEARLIHRDVKPDNILIEEETMRVRVADFGLARTLDEDFHLSQPGLLLGTPNYMSPEQVDGKPLTAASDLFSLGSVLYTLAAGHLPFQAETISGLLRAVAESAPTPILTLNPNVPDGLQRLIEKLHAKNPTDRPASAAIVAEQLLAWCS